MRLGLDAWRLLLVSQCSRTRDQAKGRELACSRITLEVVRICFYSDDTDALAAVWLHYRAHRELADCP